jgi:hypothetical protein
MVATMRSGNKLSAYGLACGFVERYIPVKGIEVTLWREHGAYHVRAHNFNTGKRLMWRAFRTIRAARSELSQTNRQIKQGLLY